MSSPGNAAWEEAMATAPANVDIYDTLELQHPTFDEPVRVVADVIDDLVLTLEDGATFNGGEAVTFSAVSFIAEVPAYAEGKAPECQVTIDNVARLLIPYLNNAITVRADLTVVWRQFRSDMTDAPCYGPVTFTLRRVTVNGTRVTGTAKLDDLVNMKFPRKIYTIAEYPGLTNG